MADNDDTPVADQPADEPVAEEPKVEEPSSTAAPAGVDQQGRQLYDAVCAKCSKPTQVPFQPSGNRPVYCRDCYMAQRK